MGIGDRNTLLAVVGAGPYGLAVASHLRAAGAEVRVFGKTMDFWDSHMPRGMLLRSPWGGSHIADPERALTLERFEQAHGCTLPRQVPLADFVRYGQWFQRQAVPDLDGRLVSAVERAEGGFRLTLDDGDIVWADGVVIATGIGAFPNIPAPLATLPPDLASHTSDRRNRDLGRFNGRHVIVVGGGQSAIESAALLRETGARVEVLLRQPELRWLRSRAAVEWLMNCRANPFKTPGKIGPLGINWLIEHPFLFTAFPRRAQDWMAYRAIRPAASSWLRPRVDGVAIQPGRAVVAAERHGDKVRLRLGDGSEREADHVLLGTGYKVAIDRYRFLAPPLRDAIRTANGYPVLNHGFESSVPGLYFVGATAAYSFGPLCRFVAGTPFTAATLTRYVRKKPAPRLAAMAPS
jgi:cation diffusion facilitator CzcD-associated flavoprotein CzcO